MISATHSICGVLCTVSWRGVRRSAAASTILVEQALLKILQILEVMIKIGIKSYILQTAHSRANTVVV